MGRAGRGMGPAGGSRMQQPHMQPHMPSGVPGQMGAGPFMANGSGNYGQQALFMQGE